MEILIDSIEHGILIDKRNRSIFDMECLHCKAKMQRGTAPFSIDRNGYHISWDAIPAWVCEQCGESLFETPEVDTIQSAIAVLDRDTASLVSS
jgi:YgiT-type zinc finger domain-containing protein